MSRWRGLLVIVLLLGSGLPAVAAPDAVGCYQQAHAKTPLRFMLYDWQTDFCKAEVPLSEIRSGGPRRDGIPPIDQPRFITPDVAAGWLNAREPVILFSKGDDARAYPLQILMWHEIVNDTVAGTPVAVTFCPLCNAAIVFQRPKVDRRILDFGTTGNLRHSDLVMWDRQTQTWWQQFDGRAIVGTLAGMQLEQLPAQVVSFQTARDLHGPRLKVLSRDTGFVRRYGKNPYVGYDDVDLPPFLLDVDLPGGHPPKRRLVGVTLNDSRWHVWLDELRLQKLAQGSVGDTPVVVWWQDRMNSALDGEEIADSRDVGQTAVFDRRLDGKLLTFSAGKDRTWRDIETGSIWRFDGEAVGGPLKGKRLRAVPHIDTFWFVWAVFTP